MCIKLNLMEVKMNKKLMAFGFFFLMSMALVSAASVSNIQINYDKKADKVFVEYDLTLVRECGGSTFNVLDHKDNIIATSIIPWSPGDPISISCIIQGGVILWGARTGTFHMSYELDTVARKDIKGLGKLDWEIIKYDLFHNRIILDSGLVA